MSIIELFKMFGDMIAGFVSWKGSGTLILAVMSIPLALCAMKAIIELYGRFWCEVKEKTKDNDR